jgi:uncharacterized protein (DUF2249 family)
MGPHVVLDVPTINPRMLQAMIFTTFDALPRDEAFVSDHDHDHDHDPMSLWHLFNIRYSGQFEWQYEQQGPRV